MFPFDEVIMVAWKMVLGMTKNEKNSNGSICTYLMNLDADFWKLPMSLPNEYASQIWNQLKEYSFIYRVNGALLMNVGRQCVYDS